MSPSSKNPETCDLKLIDELLVDLKHYRGSFEEMEKWNSTRVALDRLDEAWTSGEMKLITLSLSHYFKDRKR